MGSPPTGSPTLLMSDYMSTASVRSDDSRRPFLAVPLADLAPDLIVPGTNAPISQVAAVFRKGPIRPLNSYTEFLKQTHR